LEKKKNAMLEIGNSIQPQHSQRKNTVIPAKAGIQCAGGLNQRCFWIPAFAGMTTKDFQFLVTWLRRILPKNAPPIIPATPHLATASSA
jgi:hypothetical protein